MIIFRKTVKKLLCITLALSLIMSVGVISANSDTATENSGDNPREAAQDIKISPQFQKISENDGYILYYNSLTANVAVEIKKNGELFYASPINADADSIATDNNIKRLKSQLVVYYYSGQALYNYDSFTQSVEKGNFSSSVEDGTLYVTYNIGENDFQIDVLPQVLSKERMENYILPKLSDEGREYVLKYYNLRSKDNLAKEAYDALKIIYPSIEKGDIYIRGEMQIFKAEELYQYFLEAGYTLDDLQADCDEHGIRNNYEEKPYFNVTLEYKLTNDGMSATVNPENIQYAENYVPVRIDLLPFFGAADNTENGYMLVPDGSGSVINFNNEKTTVAVYWKKLYGEDNAILVNEKLTNVQQSVLPIFALSKDKSGFLATIDSGYEIGGISAGVSGKYYSYNYIYPFFDIVSSDMIALTSNEADTYLETTEFYSQPLSVNYRFTNEKTSYSEFALMYKAVLQEENSLPTVKEECLTELNIDVVGGAKVSKKFLGIPYETIDSITSFSDAMKILNQLGDISTDVNLIYALKGGYQQKYADRIKLLSNLGSKKELKKLMESTEKLTLSYYAQRAEKIKGSHTAKAFNKSTAYVYRYDTVSRYRTRNDALKLLSCSKLSKYAEKICDDIEDMKIGSVNLFDLGYELNSDFGTDIGSDRYSVRKSVEEYLNAVSRVADLSVDVGSNYSFKYISKIRNIPVCDSGYSIEDYSVPFYQIVVSGHIPYTVPSINLSSDSRTQFLKAVETGAQLQYSWIYEEPENAVRPEENYCGMVYENTIEEAKAYLGEYKDLYKRIADASIISHEIYSKDVTKTVWDNGTAVYVNYSDTDFADNSVSVIQKGFTVKEEE